MFVSLYVRDVSVLLYCKAAPRSTERKHRATCRQSFPVYLFQLPAEQKASLCVLIPYRIRSLKRFGETLLPSSGWTNLVQVVAQNLRLSNGCYENLKTDTSEVQRPFLSSD